MSKNILIKISAFISGISGVIILSGVFFPIISYENESRQKFTDYLSPEVVGASFDTNVSNWFTDETYRNAFSAANISYYEISIPKLKIKDAVVSIGGNDLSKNLIQYPGTALPGKLGNSVVFGHSVLPIFYNPKNYTTIFSMLPSLKKGDLISVYYDGVMYRYFVESMFEVLPSDIRVLEQDTTNSFVSLITCTPPGDPRNPRRLIVRAKLGN